VIIQVSTGDLPIDQGGRDRDLPMLRITDEGDVDQDAPRSLKNEDSRRDVPIHPALVAEGFLDYARGLPTGSPLFPDAKPDKVFGLWSTNAGKKISRWLKQDLNIRDERLSPNHSWRHYFIEACRRVGMNQEVRSALTGHSARMDESAGYGDAIKTFVHLLADNLAKVMSPVPPLGDQTPRAFVEAVKIPV
jgi:integrase